MVYQIFNNKTLKQNVAVKLLTLRLNDCNMQCIIRSLTSKPQMNKTNSNTYIKYSSLCQDEKTEYIVF